MGSSNSNFCNFKTDPQDAYILGLWCADGYHRSSSIGLSNIDVRLIKIFSDFLVKVLSKERLRLRIYHSKIITNSLVLPIRISTKKVSNLISKKSKHVAYHVYVNCRPLLREFKKAKNDIKIFEDNDISWAYLAGRFDGDGSVDKNLRNDLRIVYSNLEDANKDYELIKLLGLTKTKIYHYRTSSTYCIYVSRYDSKTFLQGILPYSVKLQKLEFEPRRDLSSPTFLRKEELDG